MFAWFFDHGVTIMILAFLAVAVFFAARSVYRARQRGGCAGCSGCSGKSGCSGQSCPSSAPMVPPETEQIPSPPKYDGGIYDEFSK